MHPKTHSLHRRTESKEKAGPAADLAAAAPLPRRVPLPPAAPTGLTRDSSGTGGAGIALAPQQRAAEQNALDAAPKMSLPISISAASPTSEVPRLSMTSKEWVIPPRPKPGRKPATDAPPTKRKAQNRAAQRAFRERRAARVGELEEQLDQQRDEQEKKENDNKDQIHQLELEVQSFRSRCLLLESMLERGRQDLQRTETRANDLQRLYDNVMRDQTLNIPAGMFGPRQRGSFSQSIFAGMSSPQQPENQHHHDGLLGPSQMMDPSHGHVTCGGCSPNGPCACADAALASTSCGNCGLETTCQCLEDAIKSIGPTPALKRPVSPSNPSSTTKKHQKASVVNQSIEMNFIDSQAGDDMPSLLRSHAIHSQGQGTEEQHAGASLAMKDGCGFCKDGTFCVCAEAAAMATPAATPTETLPPLLSQQTQTPPPSESDVTMPPIPMEMTSEGAVKLPPRKPRKGTASDTQAPTSRGCGSGGPGTCAQCQADPKSGLFCRLMSARYANGEEKPSAEGRCCGGKGPNGGCCGGVQAQKEKITLPSLPSLGLSCAEAYQTLSSHRNFDQAADDIGSWLPKLRTTPKPGVRAAPRAIEVEAASIMSVLKDFDVRFGREA